MCQDYGITGNCDRSCIIKRTHSLIESRIHATAAYHRDDSQGKGQFTFKRLDIASVATFSTFRTEFPNFGSHAMQQQ